MTFYLKPPRGIVKLHILEACIKERLLCYDYLKNGNWELSHFEYLVEDSCLDRSGHFTLRLMACYIPSFKYKFIFNELKLLEVRLESYDIQDLKLFLKRSLKHAREIFNINTNETLKELLLVLIRIISFMIRKSYLNHIFNTKCECPVKSCDFIKEVPFYFCSSMVADRKVHLKNGIARIPCYLWKDLLLSLYEIYLGKILIYLKYHQSLANVAEDPRIMGIFSYLKQYQLENNPSTNQKYSLNINNIFEEANLFPLCMLNLFKVLEKTNRLVHNERFDLSLYMKGIGMSLSDSLKFWEFMYSKEHSTCSRCTHSWDTNKKRYTYGIRHLYGMEGSRKNYHCRPCSCLQEKTLGPREQGGCPFKQFDDSNLRMLLQSVLPNNNKIEVMVLERKNNPSTACSLFLEAMYRVKTLRNLKNPISFENPVDFYLRLKKEIANGLG